MLWLKNVLVFHVSGFFLYYSFNTRLRNNTKLLTGGGGQNVNGGIT